MKIKSANLDTVCGYKSALPVHQFKEFAFVGRSNVGKSSLLNTLLNRKSLARTSAQPGKTQTINFYLINEDFYFVDLPGYGYAKVSLKEKEKWGQFIDNYLKHSSGLEMVFLLLDIRHEPSKDDQLMYQYLVETGQPMAIIVTKEDKVKRSQIQKQMGMIRRTLGIKAEQPMFSFSSKTKSGKEEILVFVEATLNASKK